MTEHDTLKVDQHKIENDISNLEFIIADHKTTIAVRQECLSKLMAKYRERSTFLHKLSNASHVRI